MRFSDWKKNTVSQSPRKSMQTYVGVYFRFVPFTCCWVAQVRPKSVPPLMFHEIKCVSLFLSHTFQSSTQEFYIISSSLSRLGLELQTLLPAIQSQISSVLLRSLLLDTPDLLAPAHSFLKVLNEKAAKWVSSSTKRGYWEVKEGRTDLFWTSGSWIEVSMTELMS